MFVFFMSWRSSSSMFKRIFVLSFEFISWSNILVVFVLIILGILMLIYFLFLVCVLFLWFVILVKSLLVVVCMDEFFFLFNFSVIFFVGSVWLLSKSLKSVEWDLVILRGNFLRVFVIVVKKLILKFWFVVVVNLLLRVVVSVLAVASKVVDIWEVFLEFLFEVLSGGIKFVSYRRVKEWICLEFLFKGDSVSSGLLSLVKVW